ncbi:MAG TPA: hypothetical protein VE622_04370 [Nitrososphaeraceae archaeon]|jgi:hypothetical protein|nr:hypothetical protein [Nitrososphaeraceae archaeon]
MTKRKDQQHGLEHIILNDDEGGDEIWEINYDNGIAINISEFMKLNSVKDKVIKYSGNIEDFLVRERSCKNVHFHGERNISTRIHSKACSFDT